MKSINELRIQIRQAASAGLIEDLNIFPNHILFRLANKKSITNQSFWFTDHQQLKKMLRLERYIKTNFLDVTKIQYNCQNMSFSILHVPRYTEL